MKKYPPTTINNITNYQNDDINLSYLRFWCYNQVLAGLKKRVKRVCGIRFHFLAKVKWCDSLFFQTQAHRTCLIFCEEHISEHIFIFLSGPAVAAALTFTHILTSVLREPILYSYSIPAANWGKGHNKYSFASVVPYHNWSRWPKDALLRRLCDWFWKREKLWMMI